MRLIYNLVIGLFLLISISCNKKHKIPQSLIELNKIIPDLKDSAYYYAYCKDYYKTTDIIDNEELGYIKERVDKSKFIYHSNKKYLIIYPRTIGDEMVRIYGCKRDTLRNLLNLPFGKINSNYEYHFKTQNSYIIITGVDANGDFGVGDYYFDSYDYIYGFKKDSLILLDSIVSKHRENEYKNVGMSTILSKSKGSIINWKFISKNCILKEYESGEVYPEHRTDTIIFKPNSKKHSEKKCF
jgi:hypothetical protein